MTKLKQLPPCPEDMPEPAFSNLMFSNHCHVSGACRFTANVPHPLCQSCNLDIDPRDDSDDIPDLYKLMQLPAQLCAICAVDQFGSGTTVTDRLDEWSDSKDKEWGTPLDKVTSQLFKLLPTTEGVDEEAVGERLPPSGLACANLERASDSVSAWRRHDVSHPDVVSPMD